MPFLSGRRQQETGAKLMEWKDLIFPWRFEHFIGAPTMTLKGKPSPENGKACEEYLKTLNC